MIPVERALQEIVVGEKACVRRIISAEEIEIFRKLSGDEKSPIHNDPAYARRHGFKGKLAYGAMLGTLLSQLVGMHLPGRNSMCITQSFKFKKPFYVGDELQLSGVVTAKSMVTQLIDLSLKVTRGEEVIATGGACARLLQ